MVYIINQVRKHRKATELSRNTNIEYYTTNLNLTSYKSDNCLNRSTLNFPNLRASIATTILNSDNESVAKESSQPQNLPESLVSQSYMKLLEEFQKNDYNQEKFNKERLRQETMTLDKLYEYLIESFQYIEIVRGARSIIALGNTGCGKSTMFNSLIYGPEALKLKKEPVEIEIPKNGKMVKMKKIRQIIDINPTSANQIKPFKIGHNQA